MNRRDIPCHIVLNSVRKAEVKKEKGGDFWSDVICLPNKWLHVVSPGFTEVAEQLPAKGKY